MPGRILLDGKMPGGILFGGKWTGSNMPGGNLPGGKIYSQEFGGKIEYSPKMHSKLKKKFQKILANFKVWNKELKRQKIKFFFTGYTEFGEFKGFWYWSVSIFFTSTVRSKTI